MEENKKDFMNIQEDDFAEDSDANIIIDEETGTEFEVLDSFVIDEKSYVVLAMIGNDECDCDCDCDCDDEVYIYRLIEGEDTDEFVAIEDEVELANAFEEFKSRNNDLFDFEDDEE